MSTFAGRIYRITSFERFKSEYDTRSLGFVTYDTWEDPSEGPLLRALELEDGKQRILEWLTKNAAATGAPEMLVGILTDLRKTVHMQSWSGQSESSLMWEAYAHFGRAIRISTTREKMERLGGVSIQKVEYKAIGLKDELRKVFKNGKIYLGKVFSTKGAIYRDERELRLITDIDLNWVAKTKLPYGAPPAAIRESFQSIVDQGAMTPEQLKATINAWIKLACVKAVPFGHVNGFIDSVLVGPRAPNEFVAEVEAYCSLHGIAFEGKSQMLKYHLPRD